jgi:hypothetical protein
MISESAFPELDRNKPERTTGILMSHAVVGQINVTDPTLRGMAFALARLVDGVCLDYTAARKAYFQLYKDQDLGGATSFSSVILPMFHHIENCLSNLERAREMADAIRTCKPEPGLGQLIDKSEWRTAETFQKAVADFRNAIQHQHNDLKRGVHHQAALEYRPPGDLVFGSHVLALTDLAKSVEAYRAIALRVVRSVTGQTAGQSTAAPPNPGPQAGS